MVLVRARDLHKTHGRGRAARPILQGADLDVQAGELVAVVGRSGTGKSTLLHLLGALEPADRGEIELAGERIDGRSERVLTGIRRRRVGFVFQVVAPPEGLDIPRRGRDLDPQLVDRLLAAGTIGRTEPVPADPRRAQPLDAAETVRRLRRASGAPGDGPRMDSAFDLGPRVRAIAVDTVRRDRLASGLVTDGAVAHLRRELARAGDRWVVLVTHEPLRRTEGAARLYALLDAHPRTLASFSGSTHRAEVRPRRAPNGGWWEISTTSLADFPMQARMVRVRGTADGGARLETWMLDMAPEALADTARELAFLDAQGGRPRGLRATAQDRNVALDRPPPR